MFRPTKEIRNVSNKKKTNMSTIVSFFNKTSTRKESRFDLFLNLSEMADCMQFQVFGSVILNSYENVA
jgi:hypothetical protein